MTMDSAHWHTLEQEVLFTASRSSGPGGQHVNKVNSRLTLHFDIWNSALLTTVQKTRIAQHLVTRVTKNGILKLHAQRHRSQEANRADLVSRFRSLIADSLQPQPVRRKTRVPQSAVVRKVMNKKRRAQVKQSRVVERWHDE